MPNPWMILGVVVAFVLNGFYWNHSGHAAADIEWTAKIETERAEAERHARDQESTWQGVVNGTVKEQQAREAGIRRNLDIALNSLRNRPERPAGVSETPRVGCQGGTGAELSRADAEFLEREAARADGQRSGLIACYEVIDSTR